MAAAIADCLKKARRVERDEDVVWRGFSTGDAPSADSLMFQPRFLPARARHDTQSWDLSQYRFR
jgi:hypothetical protein